MNVFFDIKHLYYLPQYIPVIEELIQHNINYQCIVHAQDLPHDIVNNYISGTKLAHCFVSDDDDAREYYEREKPDWIIFGNAFHQLEQINNHSKTVLMQHGIGPKSCYYDVSKSDITYRFVEGKHRFDKLKSMFPHKKFIDTGYAKLDPVINNTVERIDLSALNLDPNKPTLLYAPTFYPSSIECLSDAFPAQLNNFNLLIKPHFFSFTKKAYRKQLHKLKHWQTYENVHVVDISQVSILPYLATADLLFSDASSTLFEFTALNKPAVWCDFYKVRWSYRGIFKWRLNKRLDNDLQYFAKVAAQVKNEQQLVKTINQHYQQPTLKQADRLEMTELLTGKVDGKSSQRIVQYILKGNTECE